MKIDFPIKKDKYAEYCTQCKKTYNKFVKYESKLMCSGCNAQLDRVIIIDPKLQWWLDDQSVYWHESVGILLVNKGRILFYELTKFPYGLTVPAGHVDQSEKPLRAVLRETSEEVGITLKTATECVRTNIHKDSCRRGSDDHRWTLFAANINDKQKKSVVVDGHEGKRPTWLTIDEILERKDDMPQAMQFLFSKHYEKIQNCISLF